MQLPNSIKKRENRLTLEKDGKIEIKDYLIPVVVTINLSKNKEKIVMMR